MQSKFVLTLTVNPLLTPLLNLLNLLSKQIHIWTTCPGNRDYRDVSETEELLQRSDPASMFQGGQTGFIFNCGSKLSKTDVRICKTSSVRWDESQESSKIKTRSSVCFF